MKVLLMSLNSKFIHTNLAIQSLKKYYETYHQSPKITMEVKEYTINNDMDSVLRDISKGAYTHIFASAYIWNIEPLVLLFSNYSKINQTTKIVFGGPEVTYNAKEQLLKHRFLDAVVFGEGEKIFGQLLENIANSSDEQGFEKTDGIAYRLNKGRDAEIIINPPMQLIDPLDLIPFPYDSLEAFENRIIYYESARGCPYSCSYCLSSASQGVRYLGFERFKSDMSFFLKNKVNQVKFVDRTFNANKKHAIPILKFLIENDNGITNFHFEITATLLDEDYFKILKNARPGLFQFEIGIQTTYQPTMYAIHRPIEFDKLKQICQRLIEMGGIHIHVDLIAGLPFETFTRFLKSFDDVYEIGAEQLQLGFLKILKGTLLSQEISQHGYKIRDEAPYEVLCNHYISFAELSTLKDIETLVEYYPNSGKFKHAINYFMYKMNVSPSSFFVKMSHYYNEKDYFSSPIGTFRLYEILYEYYVSIYGDSDLFKDLLKVDYYYAKLKGQRDLFNYIEIPNFNSNRVEILKDNAFVAMHFGEQATETGKQLLKNVAFITLKYDIMALIKNGYKDADEQSLLKLSVIMFNYQDVNAVKIVSIDIDRFL
jgi:radical SAM superfamily enzyme YgiQ (UPF0313 family)